MTHFVRIRGLLLKISLLLFMFFNIPLLSPTSAEGGTIKGKVLNGSQKFLPLPNQEVFLSVQKLTGLETERLTSRSDAQGNFSFSDLAVDTTTFYHISTKYNDLEFFSGILVFKQGENTVEKDVLVFDTTSSDAEISVKMIHIFINAEIDPMSIIEIMVVENSGGKAYIGTTDLLPGKKVGLEFPLPKGYLNPMYMVGLSGRTVIPTPHGLFNLEPVKPGMSQIAFQFRLKRGSQKFFSRNLLFQHHLRYNTENIAIFITPPSLKVVSDQLKNEGVSSTPMTDRQFLQLVGANLKANSEISIGFSSGILGMLKQIGAGLLIAVVILIVVISIIKRRREQDTAAPDQLSPEEREELQAKREELLKSIAELDDLHESGGINEEEYQKKREELKEQALELTNRLSQETE